MVQVTDWDSFVSYFEEIATKHKQINSFCFGTLEKKQAFTKSGIDYPCLWLEIPDFKPEGDGVFTTCTSAFTISTNAEKGDHEAETLALKLCSEIGLQVVSKMRKDSLDLNEEDQPFLEFNTNDADLEAGIMIGVDNEHGYRVQFTIRINDLICYDEEKWDL